MADNKPLVSVGIPTYNHPEGLQRTLRCITEQTYCNLEIIVSDNCSPETETETIVREFMKDDRRIQYFRQAENKGANYNFDFVLRKATGEYFMWAADDDEWEKEFIQTCIDNIGDVGSVMTGFVTLFRTKSISVYNPLPAISKRNTAFRNALNFLKCLQSPLFYGIHRRETILCVLRDTRFDFYDCFFVLRQILNNGFVLVPTTLYRAGIDTDDYIIKPFKCKEGKLLEYSPFFWSSVHLIIQTRNLKLVEKLILLIILSYTVLNLFITYERGARPFQVRLVGLVVMPARLFTQLLVKFRNYLFVNPLKKSIDLFSSKEPRLSFAQSGEDLIVDFVFNALGLSKPSYLDIGTYHPTYLNNTYLFYQKGCKGVCIEPNPALFDKIQKMRERDICLNVGVGTGLEHEADFFVMSSDTLSTFSKETAQRYQSYGNQRIERVIRIPLVPVNDIINEHFKDCPDFVSLDVEGMELEVLKTFDFASFHPAVFCIETLTYSEDKTERKIEEISALMHTKGYFTYADTYINTIFVDKQAWLSRK